MTKARMAEMRSAPLAIPFQFPAKIMRIRQTKKEHGTAKREPAYFSVHRTVSRLGENREKRVVRAAAL